MHTCLLRGLNHARTSEAVINKATLGRNKLFLPVLAISLCCKKLVCWTIVDVWTVRRINWNFRPREQQLPLCDPSSSDTLPNHQPAIIHWITVEIAAMPILPRNGSHTNLGIDVVTLRSSRPAVNLDGHSLRQRQMHDFHWHACTSLLHCRTIAVVHRLDQSVFEWCSQCSQNRLSIPRRRRRPNDKLVVLQKWAANRDFFHNGQSSSGLCWCIVSLDP